MKDLVFQRLTYSIAILWLLFLVPMAQADSLIQDVSIDNQQIDKSAKAMTSITFDLVEPCKVNLFICDVQGNIVRNLAAGTEMSSGNQMQVWNGNDEYDNPVADGIYFPIIQCQSKRKGTFVYNPSSEPWGESVTADNIHYDAKNEELSFDVAQTTYGRLRVGLKEGGPVYKNLATWQLWPPGKHTVTWDGKDVQGFKSVLKKEKLSYSFDAFTLPPNTITVFHSVQAESLTPLEYKRFAIHPPRGGELSYFSLEAASQGAEPELTVTWQNSKMAKGKALLKGKAVCTVTFADMQKRASTLKAGSELILYVDDNYIIEHPIDSFPASIGFDTNGFSNGQHEVTINLLTTDDRAGISLHNVIIKN